MIKVGIIACAICAAAGVTVAQDISTRTKQDISTKTKEAAALAEQGKFVEAFGALDEAEAAIWDRIPLTIQRALWVADSPTGFGLYTPRPDNIFAAGAPMHIYAEPIGFGRRKSGDLWHAELRADLVLKKHDGAELVRQADFQKLGFASWVRNREFMTTFTYTFDNIPKGEYQVDTNLRDAVTGKAVTFSLPFVVR
jgi:hypothetical protein